LLEHMGVKQNIIVRNHGTMYTLVEDIKSSIPIVIVYSPQYIL